MREEGKLQSVSGYGSSLQATTVARQFLARVISQYQIKTVCDCPCGDLNWMSTIDLSSVQYQGFDLLPELVQEAQGKFPAGTFRVFDALTEILPQADLVVCRDFLFHLNATDIARVLRNLAQARPRYLLTTSFAIQENIDLPVGCSWGFHKINLQLSPYAALFADMKLLEEAREFGDRFLQLYTYDS